MYEDHQMSFDSKHYCYCMTRKIIQYSEHRTKSQCSYIYSPLLVEENKTEEASILGHEVSLHDLTNAGCS